MVLPFEGRTAGAEAAELVGGCEGAGFEGEVRGVDFEVDLSGGCISKGTSESVRGQVSRA